MFRTNFTEALTFLVLIFVLFLNPSRACAQPDLSHPELYNEIARADSLAFSAFNARDLNTYMSFYTEDVEFFHDQTGLTTPRDTLKSDFEILFRPNRPTHVYRELIDSSLQVYLINHYGAVQLADHRLYEVSEDGKFTLSALAKLYVIWKKVNDDWKMSRVVSYAHHLPTIEEKP